MVFSFRIDCRHVTHRNESVKCEGNYNKRATNGVKIGKLWRFRVNELVPKNTQDKR